MIMIMIIEEFIKKKRHSHVERHKKGNIMKTNGRNIFLVHLS